MNLQPVLHKVPMYAQIMYWRDIAEIQLIRDRWKRIRTELKGKALVEHNALTREMHETERHILGLLCPDLNSRDPIVKKKAIKWILKQPWGRDFSPAPIDKKFRGIELGSANAKSTSPGSDEAKLIQLN